MKLQVSDIFRKLALISSAIKRKQNLVTSPSHNRANITLPQLKMFLANMALTVIRIATKTEFQSSLILKQFSIIQIFYRNNFFK